MKANFNKDQINILGNLTNKSFRIAKSGNLFFDFSNSDKTIIIKIQKSKNGYSIRRMTNSEYFNNVMHEHPLNYNKYTGKYKFKTFESMLSYFITYLKRNY